MLALGIHGEYLGRLHLNVNRKPQYTVRSVLAAEPEDRLMSTATARSRQPIGPLARPMAITAEERLAVTVECSTDQ